MNLILGFAVFVQQVAYGENTLCETYIFHVEKLEYVRRSACSICEILQAGSHFQLLSNQPQYLQ